MSTGHAITIDLPPELYVRIQQMAANGQTSIEQAILDMLTAGASPTDLETQLSLLDLFSTEQLWALVYQRFDSQDERRMAALIERAKGAKLPASEQAELDKLLDIADYLVLLRSKALATLKERGQDVDSYLNRNK